LPFRLSPLPALAFITLAAPYATFASDYAINRLRHFRTVFRHFCHYFRWPGCHLPFWQTDMSCQPGQARCQLPAFDTAFLLPADTTPLLILRFRH
jgi:hypothetical protein